MALLFWEGFDSYTSLTELQTARPLVSTAFSSGFGGNYPPAWNNTGGRFNGKCLQNATYTLWGRVIVTTPTKSSYNELYTGRAVKTTSGGLICFWGTTNDTLPEVFVDVTGGQVRAWAGGNGVVTGSVLLGQTAPSIMSSGWNWIEARAKISSTNSTPDGEFEVWLNNVKIISNTACITRYYNAATGYKGVNTQATVGISDDMYVLDTTGPAPWNTVLGDCRIATVPVVSDRGPNDGNVSTGNTNHWTVVDEIPFGTSDYIQFPTDVTNKGEMFGISNLPNTNVFSVIAATVVTVANKSDAGNAVGKIVVRTNDTYSNSNVAYLATSAEVLRYDILTHPVTGTLWSFSDLQSANVGFYTV